MMGRLSVMMNASSVMSTEESEESGCSGGASESDMRAFIKFTFWMDIGQTMLAILGFIANLVVIPILCSERMRSIFNRLLASLVMFDNLYLVLVLLETLRRNIDPVDLFNVLHTVLFYPMRNMVLCCTIYLAITLALERYRAIRHPIQYHNANAGVNPWKKVILLYVLPVVFVSTMLGLPKFFELTTEFETVPRAALNATSGQLVLINVTRAEVKLTKLRFSGTYVLWYRNVAKIIAMGLLPFVTLTYLNLNVFSVIRRRRHLEDRFINVQSNALKAEAAKQSYVLFGICGVFVLGHSLRVGLNVHEFYVLDNYLAGLKHNCFVVSLPVLILGSVSNLLLTMNSSVNFAIYCFMSTEFRNMFIVHVKHIHDWVRGRGVIVEGGQGQIVIDLLETVNTTPDQRSSRSSSRPRGSFKGDLASQLMEMSEHVALRSTSRESRDSNNNNREMEEKSSFIFDKHNNNETEEEISTSSNSTLKRSGNQAFTVAIVESWLGNARSSTKRRAGGHLVSRLVGRRSRLVSTSTSSCLNVLTTSRLMKSNHVVVARKERYLATKKNKGLRNSTSEPSNIGLTSPV